MIIRAFYEFQRSVCSIHIYMVYVKFQLKDAENRNSLLGDFSLILPRVVSFPAPFF